MMSAKPPWHNHVNLSDTLAAWRDSWSGRDLFRVSAGPGWLRLHLEGDDRAGIILTAMPGANLVFAVQGSLPNHLNQALSPTHRHPVQRLLSDYRLDNMGMLPQDNVAAFRLSHQQSGHQLFLLHRLFGSRSNTVILDLDSRLHWSLHRPPHPLLAEIPDPATWATGSAATGDTVSEAARDLLVQRLALDLQGGLTTRLGRQVQSSQRLVVNLSADLKNADRGEEYRRQAEALAANLHLVKQGMSVLATDDLRDGSPLEIGLDESLAPATNLNNLFKKARKAEKGLQIIQERLATAEGNLTHLQSIQGSLDQVVSNLANSGYDKRLTGLQIWGQGNPEFLPSHEESGGRRRKARLDESAAKPFRRYLIEGRWEVWVGRNNQENDQLTHRAAHPKDLWFHAQGVTGSHVILRTAGKTDNIPHKILEKAAALAALHSKAKHSAVVPVIWTERRYVRKPRKAPPGTAVCLREKSLFVEPGVLEGVELSG